MNGDILSAQVMQGRVPFVNELGAQRVVSLLRLPLLTGSPPAPVCCQLTLRTLPDEEKRRFTEGSGAFNLANPAFRRQFPHLAEAAEGEAAEGGGGSASAS